MTIPSSLVQLFKHIVVSNMDICCLSSQNATKVMMLAQIWLNISLVFSNSIYCWTCSCNEYAWNISCSALSINKSYTIKTWLEKSNDRLCFITIYRWSKSLLFLMMPILTLSSMNYRFCLQNHTFPGSMIPTSVSF